MRVRRGGQVGGASTPESPPTSHRVQVPPVVGCPYMESMLQTNGMLGFVMDEGGCQKVSQPYL